MKIKDETNLNSSPSGRLGGAVFFRTQIETPLGAMYACATDQGICLLEFDNRKNLEVQLKGLGGTIEDDESPFFPQLRKELAEYFNGKRTEFTVPLDFVGTDFRKQVWTELVKVPYGKTVSYLQLAKAIGNEKAVRAVANANATNKIAIIVPCHRVIGSDGSLTGYAGGLERKRRLLELENAFPTLFGGRKQNC